MDGNKFGSFERGVSDFGKAFVTDTKKTVSDTAKAAGQQSVSAVIPKPAEPQASQEGSAFEQNATGKPKTDTTAQQLQHANAYAAMGESASAGGQKTQKEMDDQKLAYTRRLLHQQSYYRPTFESKPRQIEHERTQQYQSRLQEEQKKAPPSQLPPLEESKKKTFMPIGLNKKAKGEVGKAGS